MNETQWYLTRQAGKKGPLAKADAFGPLTTESLLRLASSGKVGADALVWIDGTDVLFTLGQFREMASPGKRDPGPAAIIEDAPPPAPSAADNEIPDWLAEMAKEAPRPRPKPEAVLDWLEDVRRSEGLAACVRPAAFAPARTKPPVAPSTNPNKLAAVPLDWLEDIRQIEESLRTAAPVPRKEPRPAHPAPPTVPVVEALKMALPVPAQVVPPPPAALPPVRVVCPPTTPVAAVPATPVVPPSAQLTTGYDAETGQILDPAAYALYQKAEAQRRQQEPAQPTLSVAEVFIHAHRALQNWADAEENKNLILRGDVENIKACPAVRDVFGRYANYGPVMCERLERRLAVLVDNRKKFLKAFGLAP